MNNLKLYKNAICENIYNNITKEIYYKLASKNAVMPYAVLEIRDLLDNAVIEVNCWDNSSNYSKLDELSTKLIKGLNGSVYSDTSIYFSIFFISQTYVDDNNSSIKRKRIQFKLNYKEK